ncbi:MAG: replication initiation factor domain-containing protein [Propionibacteriaceae bacterium]|nr:replication initiation factor domain-containing protein [Propionibacteriaceae bacterium]
MDFAQKERVSITPAGDWFTEGHPKGCTLYVGSRKSAIFLRCYEKGKQLGDPVSDWVRVELQVRPQRDQRLSASRASADELWGFGGWSRTLAPSILGGRVPNAVRSHRSESPRCVRRVFS